MRSSCMQWSHQYFDCARYPKVCCVCYFAANKYYVKCLSTPYRFYASCWFLLFRFFGSWCAAMEAKDKVQLIKDVQLSFNANLCALCLVDVGTSFPFFSSSSFFVLLLFLSYHKFIMHKRNDENWRSKIRMKAHSEEKTLCILFFLFSVVLSLFVFFFTFHLRERL